MKVSVTGSLAGAGLIVIGRCTSDADVLTHLDRIFRAIAIAENRIDR
jgi:hypothetical protein